MRAPVPIPTFETVQDLFTELARRAYFLTELALQTERKHQGEAIEYMGAMQVILETFKADLGRILEQAVKVGVLDDGSTDGVPVPEGVHAEGAP